MNASATATPRLSAAEWGLIIELLDRERRDLPGEIHHTDKKDYRDELRQRLEMVEDLLLRLRSA